MKKKVKVKKLVEGVEKEVDEMQEEFFPGYLEAVYHLYSMAHKHGPVVVRLRTNDRAERAPLPSLTPVWRSAEFQEREIYDLYGIHFDGHPDLRRILMWDEFTDFPMRKDYREPDDLRIRADSARRRAGESETALRSAAESERDARAQLTLQ